MSEDKKENSIFDTLFYSNVNDKVSTKDKKGDLTYLSWAFAWGELCKLYPEATYKVHKTETGLSYFGEPNIGYEVRTELTIKGLTREMYLPVQDFKYKALKAESYTYFVKKWNSAEMEEKTVDAITSNDINKSIMRCLVKNIAVFGLGLYIYAGDDLPEAPPAPAPAPAPKPKILSDKEIERGCQSLACGKSTIDDLVKWVNDSKFDNKDKILIRFNEQRRKSD